MGVFGEVVWTTEPLGPKTGTNGAAIPKKLMPLEIPKLALPECTAPEIDLFHSILAFNCGKRNESVNAKDIPTKAVETHNEDLEKAVEPIVASVPKAPGTSKQVL